MIRERETHSVGAFIWPGTERVYKYCFSISMSLLSYSGGSNNSTQQHRAQCHQDPTSAGVATALAHSRTFTLFFWRTPRQLWASQRAWGTSVETVNSNRTEELFEGDRTPLPGYALNQSRTYSKWHHNSVSCRQCLPVSLSVFQDREFSFCLLIYICIHSEEPGNWG